MISMALLSQTTNLQDCSCIMPSMATSVASSPARARLTGSGSQHGLVISTAAVSVNSAVVSPMLCPTLPLNTATQTAAAAGICALARPYMADARLTKRSACSLTSPFLSRDSLRRLQTPPKPSPAIQVRLQSPRRRITLSPVSLFEPLLALVGLTFAAATATLAFIPVTIFAVTAVTAVVGCIAAVSSLLLPLAVLSLIGLGVVKFPTTLVLLFLDKTLAVLLAGYFLTSFLSYIGDVSRLRAARKKNYSDHSLREMVGLDPIPWGERLRLFFDRSSNKMRSREAWRKWQAAEIGGAEEFSEDPVTAADWVYQEARHFHFEMPTTTTTADRRFGWFYPSAVSLVPVLNGLAWVLALRQSSEDIVPPLQSSMVRNAVIYSSPALLFLLGSLLLPSSLPATTVICTPWFIPVFQSCKTVAVTAASGAGGAAIGPFAGLSWWVSLLLGAVSLQMERDRAAEMLRCREVIEEVDERERRGRVGEEKGRMEEDEAKVEERRLRDFDEVLRRREAQRLGPPTLWSSSQVAEWLSTEGFGSYASAFESHRVTGTVLLELTSEELRGDLGVTALGDRKAIMAAIARLKRGM